MVKNDGMKLLDKHLFAYLRSLAIGLSCKGNIIERGVIGPFVIALIYGVCLYNKNIFYISSKICLLRSMYTTILCDTSVSYALLHLHV